VRAITWGLRYFRSHVPGASSLYWFSQGYRARVPTHIPSMIHGKSEVWVRTDRSIMTSAIAKMSRLAERYRVSLYDVIETAEAVTRETGRMSLYYPGMDVRKLIEAIDASDSLRGHVRAVLNTYMALGSHFAQQFIESLEAVPLMEHLGYVWHDDSWYNSEELRQCALCEDYIFPDENETLVYDDAQLHDAYEAHQSCCYSGDYAVQHCPLSDAWFDTSSLSFGVVEDYSEYVCIDACMQRGLIVEDEDDDGDPIYHLARATVRRSNRLAGYHAAPRSWRNGRRIPNGHVGVELELGFTDGDTARAKFLEKYVGMDGRALDGPFIFERDGSLDSIPGGMEIISDPLPIFTGYQAKDAPWRTLLKNLYDSGAAGWKYRKVAGIHVNLCVVDEADASLFKYASFIGNAEAMSKFIAGRKNIFGTDAGYTKTAPYLLRGVDIQSHMEGQFACGKYCAVNRRDRTCLETRIFGSNIRYEGFMACVEYCLAAMEFVRPLHILDVSSPTIAGEFRNWLGAETNRFPNLAARLGIVAHPRGSATPSTSRVVPALLAA